VGDNSVAGFCVQRQSFNIARDRVFTPRAMFPTTRLDRSIERLPIAYRDIRQRRLKEEVRVVTTEPCLGIAPHGRRAQQEADDSGCLTPVAEQDPAP